VVRLFLCLTGVALFAAALSAGGRDGPRRLPPGPAEPPVLKTYLVTSGHAEALAKLLDQVFKDNPYFRVTPVGNGSLMIYAPTAEQQTVERWLTTSAGRRRLLGLVGRGPAVEDTEPAVKEPALPTYAFPFQETPWPQALEWLSSLTDLPIVTTTPAARRPFLLTAPKHDDPEKKYTIPEIIDIINGKLAGEGLYIYRRQTSLCLCLATQLQDLGALKGVTPQELASDQLGKTELVRVIVRLARLEAEDVAKAIKKKLGSAGQVKPLTEANLLVLADSVAHLREAVALVRKLELESVGDVGVWSYKCLHAKAHVVAARCRELFGAPRRLHQAAGPRISIVGDVRTNQVLVTGPAEAIAVVRARLDQLDVPEPPPDEMDGPAVLRTYSVTTGQAEIVAAVLQQIFRESPEVRVTPVGSASVMVYAPPPEQKAVSNWLTSPTGRRRVFRMLGALEPSAAPGLGFAVARRQAVGVRIVSLDELQGADLSAVEVVRVVYQEKVLSASNLGPGIKKLMGPLGQVAVLEETNQLVLSDTVENLRGIINAIRIPCPGPAAARSVQWSHQCKYCDVNDVVEKCRELLGAPRRLNGGRGLVFFLSAEQRTNTLFVDGPAHWVAVVKAVAAKLDDGPKPAEQADEAPVLRTYTVVKGQAEAVAKALQQMYQNAREVRVTAVGNDSVLVFAPPAEQEALSMWLTSPAGRRRLFRVVGLHGSGAGPA
jgi:type II secretory pathway component GspD/PulD (secretin)